MVAGERGRVSAPRVSGELDGAVEPPATHHFRQLAAFCERHAVRFVIEPPNWDGGNDPEARWLVGLDAHGSRDWPGAFRRHKDPVKAAEAVVAAWEEHKPTRTTVETGRDGRPVKWTRLQCLRAFHDYMKANGEPPTRALQFSPSAARREGMEEYVKAFRAGTYPDEKTVRKVFGSWAVFVQLGWEYVNGEWDEEAA